MKNLIFRDSITDNEALLDFLRDFSQLKRLEREESVTRDQI